MAKKKIDLKNVKDVTNSGKPKKKGKSWNYDKPKQQKQNKQTMKAPKEWLYLSEDVDALTSVKNACADELNYQVEYWQAAGVIEVVVDEQTAMDFEEFEIEYARDESLEQFCKDNHMKMAASVTVNAEDLNVVRNVMRKISSSVGGFFCLDDGTFKRI